MPNPHRPTVRVRPSRLLVASLLTLSGAPAAAQGGAEAIRLNQVGYYPAAPKVAVIAAPAAERFAVVHAARGDTVMSGRLGPGRPWAPSGELVRTADFGALRRPGRYVLAVEGVGRSAPFVVGDSVGRALARGALKAFYYQRASTALPARFAGRWSRPGGHPDTAVLVHPSAAEPWRPAGSRLAAPGGWYDAGDYNKYVVNSGISTYTLLLLAEQFPSWALQLETSIPEHDAVLPDVLHEALWNLRWMRTMQDRRDGGVYHKLTTAEFDRFEMPDRDTAARYVVQKSTGATLDFAATAAHAAVVLRQWFTRAPWIAGSDARAGRALADSLVVEALSAWRWARQHPDSLYDQRRLNAGFDPDVNTGAYGDRALDDELQWAAAELWLATRADSFLVAARGIADTAASVPGFASVRTLGLYSLVEHRRELGERADTLALSRRLRALADTLLSETRASGYGVPMIGPRDFPWGSNSVAANKGLALIQAFRATGDSAYLRAAVATLDYLLGRNATGYSFVTGFGERPPLHPHHRPSAADSVAAPVPGFLVGGPNPGQQDHCAGYPSRLPALSYLDDERCYAANEIAINWNAPLAYLAGAVDALLGHARQRGRQSVRR